MVEFEVSEIFTSTPIISRATVETCIRNARTRHGTSSTPMKNRKETFHEAARCRPTLLRRMHGRRSVGLKRAVSHMFRSTSFRPTRVETQIAPFFLGPRSHNCSRNRTGEIRREIFPPREYTGRDPEIISLMSTAARC